jgi:hypothetical protein
MQTRLRHPLPTLVLAIALLVTVGTASPPALAAQTGPAGTDGLRILRSDAEGVVLEIEIPPYSIQTVEAEDHTYQRVHLPGYSTIATPGAPELPQKALLLGIPPDATLNLTILAAPYTVAEGIQVHPAPDRRVEPARFVEDTHIHDTDAFFPPAVARIGEIGYLRDQRFVQLLVNPLQVNPTTRELRHHHRIRLQLGFSYPLGRPEAVSGRPESPGFESVLRDAILNAETAQVWRARPDSANLPKLAAEGLNSASSLTLVPDSAAEEFRADLRQVDAHEYLTPPAYKISVDGDGIYQLTYSDLQTAGLPVDSLNPRTLRLFNAGAEVAIHVTGQDEDSFVPGERLLFYGQGLDTKYTDTNVYWLTYGEAHGLRMAARDGTSSGTAPAPPSFTKTLHLEENVQRDPKARMTPDDDHWWWRQVLAAPGTSVPQTITFTLSHIASEPYSATVRANLHGRTYSEEIDPDHHAQIYLNGRLVDEVWWDGFTDRVTAVPVPSSALLEGTNIISVTAPNDTGTVFDAFYTNWFEIDYRKAYVAEDDALAFTGDDAGMWQYELTGFSSPDLEIFDVTDPLRVSQIVSTTVAGIDASYTITFEDTITRTRHYLALNPARRLSPLSIVLDAPSDLRDPTNGADHIIITHGDFYTDALPLANHRVAQGLRSVVVDVQDVYDEFGYGVFDPGAIRDFLQYAYQSWVPPAPSYVLLVGNGHYDFRGYASSEPNYVPPYLLYVDPYLGEVAADNRYAAIRGDDILPDLFIGRLPVSSPAEAATVVSKILAYEGDPPEGDWNRRALFIADNVPDEAGDFVALSDDLADNYLPAPYAVSRIHLNDICGEPDPDNPTIPCPAATAPITSAISQGNLLVSYIGHGSRDRWAHERVFDIAHVSTLRNQGRLPVFLSMTCLTGDFSVPEQVCLDGSLLRAEGGGAIATWSCTAEGESAGHKYLNRGFFNAVFYDDVGQIGQAAVRGKLHLFESSQEHRNLIDTYTLFGDPATPLNAPIVLSQRIHLPLIYRAH